MYQLPITNVDKIRRARRSVKRALSDIGLEDCQEYLKAVTENSEKNSDDEDVLDDTEWVDFTEGFNGKMEKRWPYRSRNLCCAMCKYSSQNIYTFRSHVSRHHSFMESVCALGVCSQCTFVGHPKVLRKHALYFHGQTLPDPKGSTAISHRTNEKYHCVRCGFPTSLIFALKKHIILKHLGKMAEKYIGYRFANQGGRTVKIYCCKVCKGNTGTLDQMLHHMLVSPAHYAVSTQIQTYVYENKNYVPKQAVNGNGVFVTLPNFVAQQPQLLNSKTLILPSNGQPAAGTVLTLQGTPNSATLICAPGSNQAFLPPQASALVQLASAEAKGLLQPGATITLQGTLPQGQPIQIPAVSNMAMTPATLPLVQAPPQPIQQSLPQPLPQSLPQPQPAPQPSGAPLTTVPTVSTFAAAVVSAVASAQPKQPNVQPIAPTPPTPQGTMLTSQSLLSHLIPTGKKVNGLPTYTFAPLQTAIPASQSAGTPLKPLAQANNSQQVKKWMTCPHCNELFPSNIFELHTEAVHQIKSTDKPEHLVARALFMKKMSDKSMTCFTCKTIVSDGSIFQHLLHGLNCVSCTSMFYSIKHLAEHVKLHNPTGKAYSDFLKLNYKIYTSSPGVLSIPHFDIQTTVPKELLGDKVVNLALITNANELVYFKLTPSVKPDISNILVKVNSQYCPFCDEKSPNNVKHLQHLKQKHFVAPTIHAILKTEAFKCVYCNGVYTGKVTQQAVMLHIQRCRCSPKQPEPPKPAPEPPRPNLAIARGAPVKPVQQMAAKAPGLYFLQMPRVPMKQQMIAPAPSVRQPRKEAHVPLKTPEELQTQQRIEQALRQAIEANKREREERAAKRQRLEHERQERKKLEQQIQERASPEPVPDPNVKLVLEPTALERCSEDERRLFCTKYFNANPYASRAESRELCRRLCISSQELAANFSSKRSKCMRYIRNNTAAVLLGFNMTELAKLKHDLEIPEQQITESTDQAGEGSEEEEEEEDDGRRGDDDDDDDDDVVNDDEEEQDKSEKSMDTE